MKPTQPLRYRRMRRTPLTWLVLMSLSLPVCADTSGVFCVWATGDSHVSADLGRGRESLAIPIRQAAGLVAGAPGFDWDIMVDAGDDCGGQAPPRDGAGQAIVAQYRALTHHYREDVYPVAGNHDADYYDLGVGAWFQKWLDPLGQNTASSEVHAALRRFPVDGTWEHYAFRAGNILFLMLSDYNSAPTPVGRGNSREKKAGGYPAGAVTRETFNWWKSQVLANQDKIIVTMHHHMLRDTTTWARYLTEKGFHGSSGGFEGSGYLYFIVEDPDPAHFRYTKDAHVFEDFLDAFEKEHGKPAIDLWLGGHSHPQSPEEVEFGQGLTEKRWGVTFVQCGALTKEHSGFLPMSRLITFTPNSDQVGIRMYLHDTTGSRDGKHYRIGWYDPAGRTVTARHTFTPPASDTRPPAPVYSYSPTKRGKGSD